MPENHARKWVSGFGAKPINADLAMAPAGLTPTILALTCTNLVLFSLAPKHGEKNSLAKG
jgi:hypothetical protein